MPACENPASLSPGFKRENQRCFIFLSLSSSSSIHLDRTKPTINLSQNKYPLCSLNPSTITLHLHSKTTEKRIYHSLQGMSPFNVLNNFWVTMEFYARGALCTSGHGCTDNTFLLWVCSGELLLIKKIKISVCVTTLRGVKALL